MCVMILNYLDKKSMYIGLYKTPNKVLSCLVYNNKRVSMGWWLLRLSGKILALLRLSVNFFQLRLIKKLKINFFCFKELNINKPDFFLSSKEK